MQGDLLNQLMEQNASSGIKAQGPAAQKRFQVFRSLVLRVPVQLQEHITVAHALHLYLG